MQLCKPDPVLGDSTVIALSILGISQFKTDGSFYNAIIIYTLN